ncbi:expressed unknown protein [Ectocarpus siliculosus]|uniref:Uncharacterized protein n=1 Tax=Ectocarpus siliculosus TaxID=2880 RepID=D7G7P1_ECTSI|nr:expressed unknown protein [Ectocarpus siliculosus]|eukprot:CBJ33995.1 expressed unknown protein [Ectocarpus siliculosus]
MQVSNAGDLNGDYASSLNGDGSVTYVSTGVIAATLASSDAPAQCADSSASDCTVNRWQITPSDADSTLPTYVVYDEALHPSTINEVWLRLDNCGTGGCQSSPAELTIVCGDGTTAAGSGTPAPVSVTASDCEAIEVAGTSGAESDGFYYDDGSELGDGVTQYVGYDVVNGELTSNGRAVVANRVDSTCATTTTSTGADACSWRQWWIEPSSSGTVSYFTYDEAGHPVDIAAGTLWYTSDDTVVPYDGDVVVTCAPATTPTLTPATSPAPTPTATSTDGGNDDGTATRMPVEGTHAPGTVAPVVAGGEDGDGDGGGGSDTVVIAAGVAGGVALLAILGAVAYKLKKNPPPPPSYDDLVGA